MSALGHYLEEEGIATVAVVLIRPQAENTKPPRALWVPFELGRPFGPPNDPAFQKRVVLAALGMLVEDGGPVRIIDFPDDDPRARARSGVAAAFHAGGGREWRCRVARIPAGGGNPAARRARIGVGWSNIGRSTVGLSGLAIGDCARYVADWLRGKAPPSPRDGFSAPLILRFAVDDLKAYCLEAAGSGSAKPSSLQLTDWFWNETATGAAIHVLRKVLQAHEDERLRLIVSNFVVPAARVRAG